MTILEAKDTRDMEQTIDALRCRIARNQRYLRAGVCGALAIRYLRQIAEDDEALGNVKASPQPG